MGFSSFSSNKSAVPVLLRFLLIVGMVALCPRAAEAGGDDDETVVSWGCQGAGPFPDAAYGHALKDALSYLEDNTLRPGNDPVEAQYPVGSPRVYARAYCYAEPCKKCLKRAAKKMTVDYCPEKIYGALQLDHCSLYYGNGPF